MDTASTQFSDIKSDMKSDEKTPILENKKTKCCGCLISKVIIANVLYIYTMSTNRTYVAMIANFLLYRLLVGVLKNIFDLKCNKEHCAHQQNQCCEEAHKKAYIKMKEDFKKFKSAASIQLLIVLFIFAKIIRFIPDSIIFWILMNLHILYKPLHEKYPKIDIDYFFTCIRQTYEGVFDLVSAVIPKYTEEKEKKNQ